MASQRISWIAVPAGRMERGGVELLRISLFAAPRLAPDPGRGQLASFPDWVNWSATAAAMTRFEIEVDGGPTLPGRRAPSSTPDPALWPLIFRPDLDVNPFEFADYADRTILSFPAADAVESVSRSFQSLVFASPSDLPSVSQFLQLLSAFAVDMGPARAQRARERMRAEQAENPWDIPNLRHDRRPLSTDEIVARALLFHGSNATDPPELPRPGAEMRSLFDFHRALAQLGDYPALLRRLGIVLDVEVDAAAFGAFSAAVSPRRLRVRPRWRPEGSVAMTETPLWTAFAWDGRTFAAAVRPGGVPELVDGLLNLSSDEYVLSELDVDGAVLKQANAALAVAQGAARRAPDAPAGEAPASLRSGGFALMRRDRAIRVHGTFGRAAFRNAQLESGTDVDTLYAEDLTRGFAVDVWDSLSGAWHSLFRRVGEYRLLRDGSRLSIEDEGFSQTAMTEEAPAAAAAAPADVRLHETVWAWNGWSLAAPRPGKAILSGSGSAAAPERVTNDAQTALPLEVSFRAAPRSLPRLRYGARYRMRARSVDLAGNAVPLGSAAESAVIPKDGSQPYLRFEPIPSPAVVLRASLDPEVRPGEWLERLVIRSNNASPALDSAATVQVAERHVAPPRTSIQSSEWHGMLDSPSGRVLADTATYDLLQDRDAAELNADDTGAPVESTDVLTVPYLPDPLARGAALRGLPGVAEGSVARVNAAGVLEQQALPGVLVRPGAATLIEFEADSQWPDVRGFRFAVVEGDGAPDWDPDDRVLTVFLPKSHVLNVPLSCFVHSDDLNLLGVWDWLRDIIEGREILDARNPAAMVDLGVRTAHVAQFALEGALWSITPARTLTLVHAVQQPLRAPTAALVAVRASASTSVNLMGDIAVHGRSTGNLDLSAEWTERVDVDEAGPGERSASDHVDTIPIRDLTHTVLRNGQRFVGEYMPDIDIVRCQSDAHPRHELGDTKHRNIRYRVTATSRFTDCFDANEPGGFLRTGDEVMVDVPASTRPAPAALEYIVPTFGWQRHTETNLQASVRRGRGLRVYLRRPWFSSGDGELLGVVLRRTGVRAPTNEQREAMKPFITQWGSDPIWGSPALPVLPSRINFPLAVRGADSIVLPEWPAESVAVAGHDVGYDAERNLWYCDIEVDTGAAYFPFVRLALARYQPSALTDCHLSAVTLAAFAQVAPDRSLIATWDPSDPDLLNVVVSGATYGSTHITSFLGDSVVRTGSEITVEVHTRTPALDDELGWMRSAGATITPLDTQRPDAVLWRGTVRLPSPRLPGTFRIIVREHEIHEGDPVPRASSVVHRQIGELIGLPLFPPAVRRLVYVDGIVL